jgi:hypothetical protein
MMKILNSGVKVNDLSFEFIFSVIDSEILVQIAIFLAKLIEFGCLHYRDLANFMQHLYIKILSAFYSNFCNYEPFHVQYC